ncbi:hypothetical protein A3C23_01485 [Candidatus Roizmanbacteria bacterium RIFCSPHIGHO2_02_FULL_37_13b]|uniref:Peptidase S9 prolyl oligopeptidase catalytic domain-containing protein n=1 Tax=Candidatus Roizmanbacteria bacterium RIFCSPLOWO2_02_FULL_36_11 TaxID=1802071 RepID=A0A1F7JIG9_9BACT|nr:MAG: hypothetical protein A3C23_01485 [Candidatus Roizmanbacteria bacterium RIFCSPHIGHO2_02_FULL_37_13b]OGK55410.1 MAG: hypothetical protein A3H78_05955 [Candidatus Roizmanbacteria bacterium RIFCSPLOWO2_02_FULL_36_11]
MNHYTTVAIISLAIFALIIVGQKNHGKQIVSNKKTVITTPLPTPSLYSPLFIENLYKRISKFVIINIEKEAYRSRKFTAYIINYESEGKKIYALMSIPNNSNITKKYPVIVFNHGYIDPKNYSTISSYKATFDTYAAYDFIVIKSDYRANGKSEGDKTDPLNRLSYPVDILNLIEGVKSLPQADINNIFIWGHSLGGDISLKIIEATDKIKGVTLWAPVSADYPESLYYFIRKNRPDNLNKIKEIVEKIVDRKDLHKLSPSQNLNKIKTPVIIHHGDNDELVPYEWSTKLVDKMNDLKLSVNFYSYKNESHNFTRGSKSTLIQRDIEFFERIIKQKN